MGKVKVVGVKNVTLEAAQKLGTVAKKSLFWRENKTVSTTTKKY